MAQKFVGIDLGTHDVKLVVITAGLRGVQVVDVIEEPVSVEPGAEATLDDAVAVALACLRERGLAHESVGIALPGGTASYRLLGFPFTDTRRISQAVPFEAEGQFAVSLDDLRYDHVEGVSPSDGGRALLVAVGREEVERVVEAFAGVDLKLVTTTGIANAQACRGPIPDLPKETEGESVEPGQLVIDIGHRTTELIAMVEKGPVAVHSVRRAGKHVTAALARAFNMDLPTAQAAKHSDAFLPHHGLGEMSPDQLQSGRVVAEALERVVRELEHTRMWLRSEHGCEVTQIRLTGGGARTQGIVEYLREQTGLPVEPVAPHGTPVRGAEGRDWTTTCAALGTAIATARKPLVQLHDLTGVSVGGNWLQERMGTLVALGVAIMGFGALDTIAQVKALEQERDAYVTELSEVTQTVLGESLSGVDEIEARLAAVEGQDLVSLVPQRGALEVLSLVVDAAKPDDPVANPADPGAATAGAEGGDEGSDVSAGQEAPASGAAPTAETGQGEQEGGGLPPVSDPTKIYKDDDLVIAMVDIRERKLEIKASATRSSAQDRLAVKLSQSGCLANIQKGKVRDQNERKVFEMSMDNSCYTSRSTGQEAGS